MEKQYVPIGVPQHKHTHFADMEIPRSILVSVQTLAMQLIVRQCESLKSSVSMG